MNGQSENIIVNSCELTPIYLIPSTSVTQAASYIITQSNQEIQQPVADNLKTFYESSGNLESGILSSPKPRILKKQSLNSTVVGNNLKLASFLLPKTESVNVQNVASIASLHSIPSIQPKRLIPPVNNVVVTPAAAAIPIGSGISAIKNEDGAGPKKPVVEIDRKIVRVGTIPNTSRKYHQPKVLAKIKPNEKPDPNASKHTSVQLIKLGETYHSLNQLSEEQMKIVNKALKMFSNKEKSPKEPAYDPVTNTKFIYKVVSPRDLAVVGKNKTAIKKKNELKKQKNLVTEEEEPEAAVEPKVTRSGRMVKLPKQMRPGVSPQKPKKKVGNVVNCFQCSAEFCSFYRLQRHYEMYPTHIPTRIHSNLFHCLLAIIKGGSEGDQANIFIQQLEQLIEKLKSLWPCLLKKMDGTNGKLCTIGDDLSRLFNMDPGKYNLNIDALNCVKDKDGHCIHKPAPRPNVVNSDAKPSQLWLPISKEETANHEVETEDCARINSVDKWPTVTKRIWKLKQQKQNLSAKKMRLISENEQPIEPGMEDLLAFSKTNENGAITLEKNNGAIDSIECAKPTVPEPTEKPAAENMIEKSHNHIQFHSAHFDIRSSPIKLPSSLVRKFQINPEKACNYQVQILQPLAIDKDIVDTEMQSNCDLQDILDNVQLPKEATIHPDISFDPAKDWSSTNDLAEENYIKTDLLFESGLTPEKNSTLIEPALLHVKDKQNYSLETPNKNSNLIEANITSKTNDLIEHDFLDINNKGDDFFRKEHNGYFEHSSLHVETKCNSLIGSSVIDISKDKAFESALSQLKGRSNNLFETQLLQTSNKLNNFIEPLLHKHDDNSLFNSSLSNCKNRSDSLFESSSIGKKDKVLIDRLLPDDNSNLFAPSLSPRKSDRLLDQSLENDKSNGFDDAFTKIKDSVHIDISQDSISENDSRLLSNQGQSVLNFLDSLGNESLGLGYPETDIRNNSVDFHLDLFSFNNS